MPKFSTDLLRSVSDSLEARAMAPWQVGPEDYLVPWNSGSCDIKPMRMIEVDDVHRSEATRISAFLPCLAGGVTLITPSCCDEECLFGISPDGCRTTGLPNIVVLGGHFQAVGAMIGDRAYIESGYRGRRLGSELVLMRAVLHGSGRRHGCLYSRDGLLSALGSHRLAVELARVWGKQVEPFNDRRYEQLLGTLMPNAQGCDGTWRRPAVHRVIP